MINNDEYKKVVKLFKEHEKSFKERKKRIGDISFSKINWSDAYLDFTPYDSIIDQLDKAKIFKREKLDSIKNHFLDDKLIYSYKNENENWGSIFIDHQKDYKMWLLFVENDDEMMLQQLRIGYHKNSRITKQLFYLLDADTEEETFMVDLFKYGKDAKLESIVRNGFYETKSTILSEREISFEYDNENIKVYSTQEKLSGNIKKNLIYEGKNIGNVL